MAAASLQPGGFRADNGRRWSVLGVAAAHLAAVWVLTQLDAVRAVVRDALPVTVVLLGPDRPPAQRVVEIAPPLPRPVPVVTAAPTLALPTPALPTSPAPAAVAEAAVAVAVVVPPAPAAAPIPPVVYVAPPQPAPSPTPPAPPPRKQVPATAVRYIVEPPFEVPRAARRAGEHGTVVLRVVVSAAGLPVQVSVHRSSGYPRLDEQAAWAMRQARFQPYTEDGRALEIEALAPVEYPAE